jgi:hypothetical protein
MGQSFLNEHMLKEIDPGDHGSLAGLSDDDHGQYLNASRHAGAHSAGRWYRIGNQSITASITTTLVYDTLVFEDDPDGDISFDTGTGILTVNTAGVYFFSIGVRFASAATNDAAIVQLVDANPATISYGRQDLTDGNLGAVTPGVCLSSIVQASASSTFQVQVRHTDSAARNVAGNTASFFSVARLL